MTAPTPRTGPFATQGYGCPKCGSILNAKAANCDGEWHADNQTTFPAPTEPEPEELAALDVGLAVEDLVRSGQGANAAAVWCLWVDRDELRAQITALQADVARLEGERDEALAQNAAVAVDMARMILEVRAVREVLEAAAIRARVLRDLRDFGSGSDGWEQRDRDSDRALAAAVERYQHPPVMMEVSTQDAPSRLPLTPQSDAEGSGVAQDVQEALGAQKGVQGAAKCRCGHDGQHHTWHGSGCQLCFGCDSFERTDHA